MRNHHETIGGRAFLAIEEGTVLHDLSFRRLVAEAGINNLSVRDDETAGEFAQRTLLELVKGGRVLEILGHLLIPLGKRDEDWTPAMAQETAAFLGGLTKPEDKAKVDSLVLTVLLDFFARGFVSLWTSPKSSMADPDGEKVMTAGAMRAGLATGAR